MIHPQLIIPGNEFLYASGEANQFFNKRRKYQLIGEKIKEVKQPYYYVGLKTQTKHSLDLYSDIELKNKIVSLPANYEVEVLVNKDDKYLLKTEFGLVGWFQTNELQSTGQCGEELVKDLCFHGD